MKKEMDAEFIERLSKIATEVEERVEKFNKDIDDQNIMYVLVKAHLYIEYELELILIEYVERPEYLKIPKMTFAQKENLVFALGIVPDSEKKSLNNFNKIRNKLAHNLDYKFNEEILEKNIIGQFSSKTRTDYEKNLGFYCGKYGDGLNGKLRCAISIIWSNLLEIRIIPSDIRRELEI